MSTYDFCDVFTLHFQIHRIQVWYICRRFVFDPYGKCWQIYHTWIKVERICYGPQDAFLCQGQFPDGYGWPLPDATQLQFTFPVPCMKYRVLYCLYYKNGYGLWNPNKLTRMSFEMFVWNVCVCFLFISKDGLTFIAKWKGLKLVSGQLIPQINAADQFYLSTNFDDLKDWIRTWHGGTLIILIILDTLTHLMRNL